MNQDVHLNDFPELKAIVNRKAKLEDLEQQIRTEENQERRELMYDTYLALSKLNYEKLMEHSTKEIVKCVDTIQEAIDNAKTFERQCGQLAEKLTEERDAHEKFYDDFVFCMIEDPKYTVESALKHIERSEKIRDQSGMSWEWMLRFHFMARLRMATKLIVG